MATDRLSAEQLARLKRYYAEGRPIMPCVVVFPSEAPVVAALLVSLVDYAPALLAAAEEAERLRDAIIPNGCPKFAEGIDPVVMLDEERKVWRDEIAAAESALSASESKLATLAEECRAWRDAMDNNTIELQPGEFNSSPTRETMSEWAVVVRAMYATDAANERAERAAASEASTLSQSIKHLREATERAERLEVVLEAIASGAPNAEPECPDTDNSGDYIKYGGDHLHFHLAKMARAALRPADAGEGVG